MNLRAVIVVPLLALCLLKAHYAKAEAFESLEGKSIVYSYVEDVSFPNGHSATNTWAGKVYLSPDGHVFLRHRGQSRFGINKSEISQSAFDTVGDRDGIGMGHRTNYRWNGTGFDRVWTQDGVQTDQVIVISGQQCRTGIERSGFAGTVTVRSESCRIVPGNALK